MRRVDRTRFERRRRLALTIGLSFTLGALTAGGLIWRVDRLHTEAWADGGTRAIEPELTTGDTAPPVGPAPALAVAGTTGSRIKDDAELLKNRRLEIPVDGISRDRLKDTFSETRAGGLRKHEAIDIMAARGTKVKAVEDGRVAKIFTSIPGGLTLYVFDPTETFAYYYAHLDRYAEGLREGQQVKRGEVIGYVGSTGNAAEDAPHLHFAILHLGADRKWWKGDPINPYPILH
jgi:murein DD-endopeptidase MepM/ murein hydrolase activator NlpD